MSMSLTSLPSELICCVAANITSTSTLCNLSRCSRLLYRCATPHLYRHITIAERIGKRNGQLRNLASLLIRRPDLAALVRHFTLHLARPSVASLPYSEEHHSGRLVEMEDFEALEESEVYWKPHDPICFKLYKIYHALAASFNSSSVSEEEVNRCLGQLSQSHASSYDCILALLLPALLKVEKLVLDLHIDSASPCLEHMIRRAARREAPFDVQPRFEALAVFVHSNDALNARSAGFIASLLKLPALQEISGGFENISYIEKGCSNKISHKKLMELDSSSSPLTSLDLVPYALSTKDLAHILRVPKALKSLSYTICEPGLIDFSNMLGFALKPHLSCLESLELRRHEGYIGNSRFLRPMTSFVRFNSLKVFKASAALFLSPPGNAVKGGGLIDIFPLTLETIHLTCFHLCSVNLLVALEHLLAKKSPRQIPSWKKLILEETKSCNSCDMRLAGSRDECWKFTHETALGTLSRVGAAKGVSFRIIESPVIGGLFSGVWEMDGWVDWNHCCARDSIRRPCVYICFTSFRCGDSSIAQHLSLKIPPIFPS